jgi:phosphoribosylformylglycinamidine (FGAM) synthase-like enzyme
VYEADMVEDRRAAPRQEAYVTAALETSQGRSTIAITHDVSAQGLLLLTRLELAVGEVIKLTVALAGAQHALSGKVVRSEPMEPHELWRYKVALAVDAADPSLIELRATLAAPAKPQ